MQVEEDDRTFCQIDQAQQELQTDGTLQSFLLFYTDDAVEAIIQYTNQYAEDFTAQNNGT